MMSTTTNERTDEGSNMTTTIVEVEESLNTKKRGRVDDVAANGTTNPPDQHQPTTTPSCGTNLATAATQTNGATIPNVNDSVLESTATTTLAPIDELKPPEESVTNQVADVTDSSVLSAKDDLRTTTTDAPAGKRARTTESTDAKGDRITEAKETAVEAATEASNVSVSVPSLNETTTTSQNTVGCRLPAGQRWKTHQEAQEYVDFATNLVLGNDTSFPLTLVTAANGAATNSKTGNTPRVNASAGETESLLNTAAPLHQQQQQQQKSTACKSVTAEQQPPLQVQLHLEHVSVLSYLQNPVRRPSIIEMWSPYEIALFGAAMAECGKQFHRIQQIVHSKRTTEIIDFYYIWKKTSHYTNWKKTYLPEHLDFSDDDKCDAAPTKKAKTTNTKNGATTTAKRKR